MIDLTNARKFVAKNEAVLLRAIADTRQTVVGDAIGHDSSYVSNFLKGTQKFTLAEVLAMLESCGIALHRMSESEVMVSRSEFSTYVSLAMQRMAEIKASLEPPNEMP